MRYSRLASARAVPRAVALSILALAAAASQAQAKDVYLAAVRTCVDKTGTTAGACAVGGTASAIPVWSFVSISLAEFTAKALQPATLASAVVPGPMLNVDSGDTSGLMIHLLNLLPVPTSLIIPGQPAALVPTWFNASTGTVTGTGSRPANDTTSRVRSLNTETAAGGTGTYTWTNLKPGSFIYESATHQGIQVQMGLHGGLIVASGTTTAGEPTGTGYPGVTYAGQVTTYLSEIDSAMHKTVDASPTNDATPAMSAKVSPLEYWPDVFLTTQLMLSPDFTPVPPVGGHNQVVLNAPTMMRFFNGSLRTHDQVVQDQYLSFVAEDGNLYRYPKVQYSVLLDAGKTKDGLFTPAAAETVAVYDRMLNTGGVGSTKQGMVAYLDIASPSTPTVANASFAAPATGPLTVTTPGVLAKAISHDKQTLAAVVVTQPANGTLALAGDGSFTYTPKANSTATSDAFAFKATETVGGTTYTSKQATATITLTPSQPASPVANADTATVKHGAISNINVLANDTGTTGFKSVNIVSKSGGTASVNPDGTIKYRRARGYRQGDHCLHLHECCGREVEPSHRCHHRELRALP